MHGNGMTRCAANRAARCRGEIGLHTRLFGGGVIHDRVRRAGIEQGRHLDPAHRDRNDQQTIAALMKGNGNPLRAILGKIGIG